MEGIDEGLAAVPSAPKSAPIRAFVPKAPAQPPQAPQVAPRAYQTQPPASRPASPNKPRPGGFSGATVPLTVRQSQNDGSFNLAGKLTFSIKLDQEALQHVTETGEGLAGRDTNGQWQEGFKVGELTVWPPFEKK